MSTPEDERESKIDSILKRAEKLAYDLKFVRKEDKATWLRWSAKLMEILSGLRLWQLEECSDEVIEKFLEHIEGDMEGVKPVYGPPFPPHIDVEVHPPIESESDRSHRQLMDLLREQRERRRER